MDDKYWPRQIDEIEDDGVSLINEPLLPDNVVALPKSRSLHAVLCEALTNTKALLEWLESRGVYVKRDDQRATVRELYVQTKRQVAALTACLELDGLE